MLSQVVNFTSPSNHPPNDAVKQLKPVATTTCEEEPPVGLPFSVLKEAELADKYECGHGRHLLVDPCQFPCGHIYCKLCIDHMLRDKDEDKCELCMKEDPESVAMITRASSQPDYACKRAMSKLAARCEFHHEGCSFEGTLKHLEGHLLTCDYKRIKCQCGLKLPKKNLADHQEFDCTHAKSDSDCCFGCSQQEMQDDVSVDEHYQRNVSKHVSMVQERISKTKQHLTRDVEQLADRVNQAEVEVGQRSMTRGPAGNQNAPEISISSAGSTFVEDSRKNMKIMEEKVKISHNLFSVLFKEVQQAGARLLSLERHMQQVIVEQERRQRELRLALDKTQCNINGVLLWEIEDIKRKSLEAQSAGHASILSPPFYTSRAGYKLCGRIYLNGDGVGRGQYLSLFIVMMKGEYDSLLAWPFNQFVTFTLIDQTGKSQHVRDSFRTDPTSTSFRRPRTEMNIASGCPRFMSLHDLNTKWNDYVVDDTMMIEMKVDTQSLENYGGQGV